MLADERLFLFGRFLFHPFAVRFRFRFQFVFHLFRRRGVRFTRAFFRDDHGAGRDDDQVADFVGRR